MAQPVMTLQTMDSSILAFVVLMIIYIHAYDRTEKVFVQYKLFTSLVQVNLAMIVIDILGWAFNGLPGGWNLLANKGFNLLLYVVEPVGPMLWLLYTNYQVYRDESRLEKVKRWLMLLWVLNGLLAVVSLQTDWFFAVDDRNIYRRGELFWLHTAFCYALLVYSFLFTVRMRHLIEKKYYHSLLLFYVPQAVGTTLQVFYYGVSYNWSGMMLSLLIVYFNIQDRTLHTDYLTGVYNRRQLDYYIQARIRSSRSGRPFSAILLDLDAFKEINDRFGHAAGDEALKELVQAVRRCLRKDDFIARYGGDEFVVVLETDDRQVLSEKAGDIRRHITEWNRTSGKPYQLWVSAGYGVWDAAKGETAAEFLQKLDAAMYDDKERRRISATQV